MPTAVTRTGWKEHERRMLAALYAFGDQGLKKGLVSVGAQIVAQYRGSITAGRSPAGKFRALSPAYAKRKAKLHPGAPILVAYGDMRDSLGFRHQVLGAGHHRLEVGTSGADRHGVSNGVKALAHVRGEGRLPVRDFARLPSKFFVLALRDAFLEVQANAPVSV